MASQFVALTKKLAASYSKSPQTEVWKCNDGKENKEGIVKDTTEEANYVVITRETTHFLTPTSMQGKIIII